jgi:hypothetical protein
VFAGVGQAEVREYIFRTRFHLKVMHC